MSLKNITRKSTTKLIRNENDGGIYVFLRVKHGKEYTTNMTGQRELSCIEPLLLRLLPLSIIPFYR